MYPPTSALIYIALSCLGQTRWSSGLEVGVPERFLQPRTFNPHPYTDVVDPGGPPDLGDDPQLIPSPASTHFVRDEIPELPDHPYALFRRPLTRGDDGRAPIQFPKVPENANIPERPQRLKPPHIKHPLNLEGATRLNRIYSSQSVKPGKKYAFSYAVLDKSSGDDFSHSQHGSGSGQTKGEYRVKLPDGRLQIVSYTADHRGYHADVRYDEDNSVDGPPHREVTGAKYLPLPPAPRPRPLQHQEPEPVHQITLPGRHFPAPSAYQQESELGQHQAYQLIRVQPQHQLHLPKPSYKTLLVDYEESTQPPIRDHTPIHEEPQEDDLGDYQENTVSSTPSYGGTGSPGPNPGVVRPSLIQPVPASFTEFGLGERAGPVKFPPTPPPEPEEDQQRDGNSGYVATTPSPDYSGSDETNNLPRGQQQPVYFTSPSAPVNFYVDSNGQLYTQQK